MIENLVEEIGYEMARRLEVFYYVPILTLSTNGLRAITDDVRIVFFWVHVVELSRQMS